MTQQSSCLHQSKILLFSTLIKYLFIEEDKKKNDNAETKKGGWTVFYDKLVYLIEERRRNG